MVSFAFSAILTGKRSPRYCLGATRLRIVFPFTGLVFFALGAFKLGALIGYFPRHILVG